MKLNRIMNVREPSLSSIGISVAGSTWKPKKNELVSAPQTTETAPMIISSCVKRLAWRSASGKRRAKQQHRRP